MRIALTVLAIFAIAWTSLPARAGRTYVNVVDDHITPAHGPLEIAAAEFGLAPDGPEEFVCAIYVINEVVAQDTKRAVALADQAFEEVLGAHCSRGGYRNKRDGLVYGVARCYIYIGPRIPSANLHMAKEALLGGAIIREATLVEYRTKNNIGRATAEPRDSEFERVSQPDIAVGPSLREPNMTAVPTEIEPGVTIGFENKVDHIYYDESKPSMLIFFQTPIPWSDKRAQRELSQKVVRAYAGERLKRHELKHVLTGAFNEPRRSRFHFRLGYLYAADSDGDMDYENIPQAATER